MLRFRLNRRPGRAAAYFVGCLAVAGLGIWGTACTESLPPLPYDGSTHDGATDVVAHDGQQVDQSTMETAPGDGPIVKVDGTPADGAPADGTPADGTPADGTPADGTPSRENLPTNDLTPALDISNLKAKCIQLDADYVKAVAKAKACSPMLPSIHCTVKVKSKLICPCRPIDTYIEHTSLTINKAAKQFSNMGCAKLFSCPKISCTTPKGAGCLSSGGPGTKGTCTDKF